MPGYLDVFNGYLGITRLHHRGGTSPQYRELRLLVQAESGPCTNFESALTESDRGTAHAGTLSFSQDGGAPRSFRRDTFLA